MQTSPENFENERFKKVQILVAEDNPTNQAVAVIILEKYGCHVVSASDGIEAVDLIKRSKFDIVMMDCQMPQMDGYEATKEIRDFEKSNNLNRTIIIAFTANERPGDIKKCIDAGMDDYIPKPVDQQRLEDALNKWIKIKHT